MRTIIDLRYINGVHLKVNVSEVPVTSARIKVSETARNLGFIVDSQPTLSAQVSVSFCPPPFQTFYQL